jgi:enamine deaminase RidA (YjgF/YER057c/UK114 family)
MKTRTINPTPWLQHFNLHHGIEVTGGTRTLYLSGQTSTAADGSTLHAGDLAGQFRTAWSLNIYTTHVDAFMAIAGDMTGELKKDGTVTSCTLLGVARLFDPAVMIELEATAVA